MLVSFISKLFLQKSDLNLKYNSTGGKVIEDNCNIYCFDKMQNRTTKLGHEVCS